VKIALTYTGSPEKHQYYVDWLKGNDSFEVIKLSAGENNLDSINDCDALVLSGGIDIHPKFYQGEMDYKGKPEQLEEQRDAFEIGAFILAQVNHLPILGICRGMQLINVIQKGSLVQDLSDEKLNPIHKGNPDKNHLVKIQEGSLLQEILGQTEGKINSAHHQAIDRLGEGLIVNAKSEDGIIEGIEWAEGSDKPFLLGIQWHPERMFRFQLENSPFSKAIREKFIGAIKKSKAKK
jgi:putative glutamine amidotransferase